MISHLGDCGVTAGYGDSGGIRMYISIRINIGINIGMRMNWAVHSSNNEQLVRIRSLDQNVLIRECGQDKVVKIVRITSCVITTQTTS